MDPNECETLFDSLGHTLNGETFNSFMIGAPGAEILRKSAETISKGTEDLVADNRRLIPGLQYGPSQGSPLYRQELSKFLSFNYSSPVNPEHLMVNAGATHGLHMAASTLFYTGATVFLEDPSYFVAIKVLSEDLGLTIRNVPTDENGIIVSELERMVSDYTRNSSHLTTEKQPFSCLIYLVPTFNNPTGRCTSSDRCKELIRIARENDALLFCDDVYNLLTYSSHQNKNGDSVSSDNSGALHEETMVQHSPLRLLAYDDTAQGCVISNGSFSKIFAPGLRLGWYESSKRIISLLSQTNIIASGGSPNHYTSLVVAKALQNGSVQNHLDFLIKTYSKTLAEMSDILRKELPSKVHFYTPHGGYFIWIELPAHVDTRLLDELCRGKYNLCFLPGIKTSAGGYHKNCLRISFSYLPHDRLMQATHNLASAITEFLQQIPS